MSRVLRRVHLAPACIYGRLDESYRKPRYGAFPVKVYAAPVQLVREMPSVQSRLQLSCEPVEEAKIDATENKKGSVELNGVRSGETVHMVGKHLTPQKYRISNSG
jgi:hypothetical protein